VKPKLRIEKFGLKKVYPSLCQVMQKYYRSFFLFYFYLFLFICNSPTDHTVMTEITSVKAAGQQGSELR